MMQYLKTAAVITLVVAVIFRVPAIKTVVVGQ